VLGPADTYILLAACRAPNTLRRFKATRGVCSVECAVCMWSWGSSRNASRLHRKPWLQTWALDRLLLFCVCVCGGGGGGGATSQFGCRCGAIFQCQAPACSHGPLAAVVLTADLEYMRQHACVTDTNLLCWDRTRTRVVFKMHIVVVR
jgi:hypothetical protein